MKNNMLKVEIGTQGFAANTKLGVKVRQGIPLKDRKLQISQHPWVINNPKHQKDPVLSEDGSTVLAGSFFRTQFRSFISAPLVSDERNYIHPENREVLLWIDTKVEIRDVVFVYDVFYPQEGCIQGNDVINHRQNPQLHDVNREGNLILMRMEVGQFITFITNYGLVHLGLNSDGRLDYTFGRMSDWFIDKMKYAVDDRLRAEEVYWEEKKSAEIQSHAEIFNPVLVEEKKPEEAVSKAAPPELVLLPNPSNETPPVKKGRAAVPPVLKKRKERIAKERNGDNGESSAVAS